jgi:hypothetical protein
MNVEQQLIIAFAGVENISKKNSTSDSRNNLP